MQVIGALPRVQEGTGGADASVVPANGPQNRQRLLLHFEKLLQFLHSLIVAPGAELVGHLENDRVQHRLRHRVNIAFFDFLRPGIGADFIDFTTQGGHGSACDINEVGAQVGGDALFVRRKVACYPGDQISLILLRKLHHKGAAVHRVPQLFVTLVRLPGGGDIGKNHRTVIRNIPQDFRHFLPVRFIQLENVHIINLDKGRFRHHGQILHSIRKGPEFKGLTAQAVVVEGFRQRVQQQLFHQLQIMMQKECLLPVKKVQPSQSFLL